MSAKRQKKGSSGTAGGRPAGARAQAPHETYEIEFYVDDDGKKPVLDWIKSDLSPTKRRALGFAMSEILQSHGVGVCAGSWGKQLGGGIFEFRLRMAGSQVIDEEAGTKAGTSETILLRVFCHAYGNRLILLLAGYDKGEDPTKRRQQSELALAEKRLKLHKQRLSAPKKRNRR